MGNDVAMHLGQTVASPPHVNIPQHGQCVRLAVLESSTVRNSARFAVLVPDLFSDRGATLPLQGVPRISAFLRSNCRPRPIVTQLSKVRLR
jgi:hypothetical protein